MVKTTDLHESNIRAYKVTPGIKGTDHPAVAVVRLPNLAKQSRLPFTGSEQPPNTKAVALSLRSELPPFLIWVSLFGLHKPIAESNGAVFAYINAMLFPSVALGPMTAVEAEDVVSCVQAMLELSSMVAPRTHVDLRLKGFALEGDTEEEKPSNVSLKYDIEPLPLDLTPEQRFFEGLRAWFEGEDSSTSLQLCDASPQYHADSCPAIDPLHHSAHSDHEQHAYVQHPVQGQLGEADLNQCVPAASSLPTEFEHGQPATLADELDQLGPSLGGVPMLHACHAPSAAGAHASVVLQQAFLTQAVYEQQYLTAQEVPMLQFGTSQEYMYEDQAPMDMHGFELPTDAEGYVQQEGEEGMWADSECLRQHPDPYALEHAASSDHHMHDATWHSNGSEPYGDGGDHRISKPGPNLECDDSSSTLQGCTSRPTLAIAIGQAGADAQRPGPNAKQQGAMLQRSKWTAQVGLVLYSTVPSPLAGYILPQGNAQVYLFQNYALLQRPPDSCLKALDKFAWQSFGLEAEVQALPSGAITMTFGAKSDALAKDISAVVVHLYTQDAKLDLSMGKTPALAAVTEAKLIKVALEDALSKLKTHFQGKW
ncbi:hypothetical protein ABBQ32_004607 [Trebouxia sp. C0010 RCD-2024]